MTDPMKKIPRPQYCPACHDHLLGMYDLIQHVFEKRNNCGMTLERLKAVGVIDDSDIEEFNYTNQLHADGR